MAQNYFFHFIEDASNVLVQKTEAGALARVVTVFLCHLQFREILFIILRDLSPFSMRMDIFNTSNAPSSLLSHPSEKQNPPIHTISS